MRRDRVTGLASACGTPERLVEDRREPPRRLLDHLKGRWHN